MTEQVLKKVPGLEEDQEVEIKKFTFGERMKLKSKSVNLEVKDGKEVGSVDMGKLQLYTVLLGIVKAPFFKPGLKEEEKIAILERLPGDTGEYLFEKINKLNNAAHLNQLQKK